MTKQINKWFCLFYLNISWVNKERQSSVAWGPIKRIKIIERSSVEDQIYKRDQEENHEENSTYIIFTYVYIMFIELFIWTEDWNT